MSESVEESTVLTPNCDVMDTEIVEEKHTIKKEFLVNRLESKLLAKADKYTSFVHIYKN